QLDHDAPARVLQRHQAGLRQLLREIEERRGAVVALGERRVELEQRALEQARLRRDLAVRQDLERAPDDGDGLLQRQRPRDGGGTAFAAARRAARAREVLVRDELVAVALQDHTRERAPADDKHLLVVLLQLLDEREEIAVAADDDVGVDV